MREARARRNRRR